MTDIQMTYLNYTHDSRFIAAEGVQIKPYLGY